MSAAEYTATEAALAELIKMHGVETVEKHIEMLLPKARWSDWQQLANLARNVDRRMRRTAR